MGVGGQRQARLFSSLYKTLGGPQALSGRVRKVSFPPAFVFLYSLLLCLYFIRTCFFVLIVLHFAFCLSLQHTIQTSLPPAGFEPAIPASDRPQTLALDSSASGIGGFNPRTVQPVASGYTD